MVPAAGSTYSYAYAVFGSFLAWFIGWDLLLEYLFAASTVAVGWSGYFVSFLGSIGVSRAARPRQRRRSATTPGSSTCRRWRSCSRPAALLYLGTRESTRANNVMVALKLGVLLLFIGVGVFYITSANWEPFVPDNTGRLRRLRRHRDPPRSRRRLLRLRRLRRGLDGRGRGQAARSGRSRSACSPPCSISTVLYVVIGIVMTGMVPFKSLNVADPLALAVRGGGQARSTGSSRRSRPRP